MTLATTSAAVILWPSAIVVSPLIDSLVEPTSLDAAVAGFFSGLLAARYTTSTDVTRRRSGYLPPAVRAGARRSRPGDAWLARRRGLRVPGAAGGECGS